MAGWHHDSGFKHKNCRKCSKEFSPNSGSQTYCCDECKGYLHKQRNTRTVRQYETISGSWERYFSRLVGGSKRPSLSREDLMELLEQQNYRCALSGESLTCILEIGRGRVKTNASVDRILAGGPYTKDNVQLVCSAVNSWRSNIPVDEFIGWCEKVYKHSVRT